MECAWRAIAFAHSGNVDQVVNDESDTQSVWFTTHCVELRTSAGAKTRKTAQRSPSLWPSFRRSSTPWTPRAALARIPTLSYDAGSVG